ncbi:MAG: chemotaxis-specific protein-glutamate methyltransferase CheB, partial [Steroidobacteraceae bacterium]
MSSQPIKVLVVDDTAVTRMLLVHLLESDPGIRVVGAVADGQAAVEFVQGEKPDVVLMDIHMPRLDGFEATRRIMETHPLPIVICSATTNPAEVATTFRLLEAGALACVAKPVSREHPDFESLTANLLQTVRLMSEVKVVRRWARYRTSAAVPRTDDSRVAAGVRLIGIGTSTGGPPVLQTILSSLPKEFPVPLLIVQHIARGFLPGLIEWLDQTAGLRVHLAAHGVRPLPGHAYIAPDDFHLGVDTTGRMILSHEEPENGLRPAVSYLFRSLAETCGPASIGVLLTGMGKDGARELKLLRDVGADTIAQDHATSIVHGMPGEAIALGAACHVLPPDRIADA